MKSKAAIGSLGSLFLLTFFFSSLVCAAPAPPTYDATGTWDFQITKEWKSCSGMSPPQEIGTITINQTGNTFTMNNQGEIEHGTILGSRYQILIMEPHSDGVQTRSIVWNLDSSSFGNGHVTVIIGNESIECSYVGRFSLQKQGVCTPTDTQMCLQNGRYSVSVTWKDQDGKNGVGHAIPSTDDSGLFWFFSPNNMELLIKVLDGCGINNRYWVFFAATTDQEFTVTVTDTKTGDFEEYTNPLGTPADAVTDTAAFATCPH